MNIADSVQESTNLTLKGIVDHSWVRRGEHAKWSYHLMMWFLASISSTLQTYVSLFQLFTFVNNAPTVFSSNAVNWPSKVNLIHLRILSYIQEKFDRKIFSRHTFRISRISSSTIRMEITHWNDQI